MRCHNFLQYKNKKNSGGYKKARGKLEGKADEPVLRI